MTLKKSYLPFRPEFRLLGGVEVSSGVTVMAGTSSAPSQPLQPCDADHAARQPDAAGARRVTRAAVSHARPHHVEVGDRSGDHERIRTIEDAAVPGDDAARVLHAERALEERLSEVPGLP